MFCSYDLAPIAEWGHIMVRISRYSLQISTWSQIDWNQFFKIRMGFVGEFHSWSAEHFWAAHWFNKCYIIFSIMINFAQQLLKIVVIWDHTSWLEFESRIASSQCAGKSTLPSPSFPALHYFSDHSSIRSFTPKLIIFKLNSWSVWMCSWCHLGLWIYFCCVSLYQLAYSCD